MGGPYDNNGNTNYDAIGAAWVFSIPAVTAIAPSAGPAAGGTSVTITGDNFTGATAVHFGANYAPSFTVNSAASITAIAPAGSGTVDVTVTFGGVATATSAADQFTYGAAPAVTSVAPDSGPTSGGTNVTITGTNFSAGATVRFGGAAATNVAVVSATSITATSPAGSAGTVDVTVTTAGGTSAASAADGFTYIAGPAVTSVSPSSGPSAGGTVVTITGANFSGASAVKFGGASAIWFNVGSATSILAKSPAGAGTVDVTVTTTAGTSGTSAADLFTYTQISAALYVDPENGTDSGQCPQTAPCATLNYALSQASSGGTINIVRGGTFGPIYIAQPIIINGPADGSAAIAWSNAQPGCVGGSTGSCNGNATANYAVEIAATESRAVQLNNLVIDNGVG